MAIRRARRTQAERRNQSEAALLDAAAELIAERGVDRASLARIGERAGASRGLPTHHFGSKDALLDRLARRAQDGVIAATQLALKQKHREFEDVNALEYLRTMIDTYLELFERPTAEARALIVMWGATFPSESLMMEGMLKADRRSYDGWAELVRRGQHDGSIRTDVDPAAVAVILLGMTRGIAAQLLTQSRVTDMRDVRRTCQDWITSALAASASSQPRTSGSGRRTRNRRS
jgi:AcrR family transcriptional regulator